MSYLPFNYQKLNEIECRYLPNTVNSRNNVSFDFWQRSLFQRACSTLVFDLPEKWQGSVKDFFYYCLFRFGYVVVFNTPEYGVIFQPCNLAGYDLYYQPNRALVVNPAFKKGIKPYELELGVNAQLIKLTPDYGGIFDIVNFYADKLASLNTGIDMSLVNNKFAFLVGSKTKAGAEALKKMFDRVNRGEPAVIFDNKLITDDPVSKDTPFQTWDRKIKENYITDKQLQDFETLLYNFDAEVGIPTIDNGQKKERMVVSEAEARTIDSTSRSVIWFDTLKSSIKLVNHMFNTDIDVKLRYAEQEEAINDNGDTDTDIEGGVY